MKRILVLGGTLFLGRVVVEQLIKNPNYKVTLFNRGLTNKDLFAECDKIYGDRYKSEGFAKILKHEYDCIIDTSGYFPEYMEKELELLKGMVKRYIFVSSISTYDYSQVGEIVEDDSPQLKYLDEDKEITSVVKFGNLMKPTPELYGKKKAECERLLLSCDWLDTIILRPAIIFGKYDFCDRFYYWLYRVKTKDEILVPENGEEIQNNTYVEDLADIILQSIEIKNHRNTYNVATHEPISLSDSIKVMCDVMGKTPKLTGTPKKFLSKNNIIPYKDIPSLWDGYNTIVKCNKLHEDFDCSGFSSFKESVQKTVAYYNLLEWEEGKEGMSVNKEQILLENFKKNGRFLSFWKLILKS